MFKSSKTFKHSLFYTLNINLVIKMSTKPGIPKMPHMDDVTTFVATENPEKAKAELNIERKNQPSDEQIHIPKMLLSGFINIFENIKIITSAMMYAVICQILIGYYSLHAVL